MIDRRRRQSRHGIDPRVLRRKALDAAVDDSDDDITDTGLHRRFRQDRRIVIRATALLVISGSAVLVLVGFMVPELCEPAWILASTLLGAFLVYAGCSLTTTKKGDVRDIRNDT